jgi:hypothetical protein
MKLDTSVAPEIALLAEGLTAAARASAPGAAGPPGSAGSADPAGPSGSAGSADPAGTGLTGPAPAAPPTIGYLAGCLRLLAADPQRWWDLVRFDPGQPVRIAVAAPGPGCEAWLVVLPPGYRGGGPRRGHEGKADGAAPEEGEGAGPQRGRDRQGDTREPGRDGQADTPEPAQDWQVACLVAGEVAERAGSPAGRAGSPAGEQDRPLRAGRIRVRGREPRRLINVGTGYAVSLHARALSR